MTYNITFFHGWSYDADFFKKYASELAQNSQFFDRGYYGNAHIPVLKSGVNIAITHSMGLFYLIEHYSLEDFDKIIVLSGFADFCAGRDKSIVQNLKEGLIKNPDKALRRFALLCDDKNRNGSQQEVNIGLLQCDLDILMEHNIYSRLLPHHNKIYTIHGEEDKVIPYEYSVIQNKENLMVADAGHVYSLKHNNKILGAIKSWIME